MYILFPPPPTENFQIKPWLDLTKQGVTGETGKQVHLMQQGVTGVHSLGVISSSLPSIGSLSATYAHSYMNGDKAQNIVESKSSVQLVCICFEHCFSWNWMAIFIARLL